MLLLK